MYVMHLYDNEKDSTVDIIQIRNPNDRGCRLYLGI